jgi:hypothetical protein
MTTVKPHHCRCHDNFFVFCQGSNTKEGTSLTGFFSLLPPFFYALRSYPRVDLGLSVDRGSSRILESAPKMTREGRWAFTSRFGLCSARGRNIKFCA